MTIRAQWVSLVGVLALIACVLLWGYLGFQAVSCVDPAGTPAASPAMNVRVTTDRLGHIAERHLFGCTFFSYEGPQD
jgi:hypothetical protein